MKVILVLCQVGEYYESDVRVKGVFSEDKREEAERVASLYNSAWTEEYEIDELEGSNELSIYEITAIKNKNSGWYHLMGDIETTVTKDSRIPPEIYKDTERLTIKGSDFEEIKSLFLESLPLDWNVVFKGNTFQSLRDGITPNPDLLSIDNI